jgi:hypothetical protein
MKWTAEIIRIISVQVNKFTEQVPDEESVIIVIKV